MILSHSRVSAYSFHNMSRQILFLVFLSAKKIYLKITGKPVQPFGFYVLLPSLMRLLYKKRPNRSLLYYSHPIYVKHIGPFRVFYSVPVAVPIYWLRSRVNVFFSVIQRSQGSLRSYENKPLFDVLQLRGPGAKAISDNISKLKCVSRLDISDNGE